MQLERGFFSGIGKEEGNPRHVVHSLPRSSQTARTRLPTGQFSAALSAQVASQAYARPR